MNHPCKDDLRAEVSTPVKARKPGVQSRLMRVSGRECCLCVFARKRRMRVRTTLKGRGEQHLIHRRRGEELGKIEKVESRLTTSGTLPCLKLVKTSSCGCPAVIGYLPCLTWPSTTFRLQVPLPSGSSSGIRTYLTCECLLLSISKPQRYLAKPPIGSLR